MTKPVPNEHEKPLISREDFFSSEEEKTKFNWFLFELAMEFDYSICRDKVLTKELRTVRLTNRQRADACVCFAKSMVPQIKARVDGLTACVMIKHEQMAECFLGLDDGLVNRLLTMASQAWERQTEHCCICPTRCISEKEKRAPMFDDPFYSE